MLPTSLPQHDQREHMIENGRGKSSGDDDISTNTSAVNVKEIFGYDDSTLDIKDIFGYDYSAGGSSKGVAGAPCPIPDLKLPPVNMA